MEMQIAKQALFVNGPSLFNKLEVPNLLDANGKTHAMKPRVGLANIAGPEVQGEVLQFFVERSWQSARTIVALLPMDGASCRRTRTLSAIIMFSAIFWFVECPHVALRSVTDYFQHKTGLHARVIVGAAVVSLIMHQLVFELTLRFRAEARRQRHATPTLYFNRISFVVAAQTMEALQSDNGEAAATQAAVTKEAALCFEQVKETSKLI